jgi:hypothetical protein
MISDDPRSSSGVATQARYLALGLAAAIAAEGQVDAVGTMKDKRMHAW